MSTIHLSFDIDAPLNAVWDLGRQPSRIPEWQFDVIDVRGETGPIERAGATYCLVYRRFGRNLQSPVRVARYEPPHIMQTSGATPLGGHFNSTTRMMPRDGSTRVDWEMDYKLPGWVLGDLLDRLLFRSAFERTVRSYNDNFKALAEGRQPPHPPVRHTASQARSVDGVKP